MPAITVTDVAKLPTIDRPKLDGSAERPVSSITTAPSGFEGEGFPVRRAFAGLSLRDLDPFVHMDQMGEVNYAPGEPKGTPWHPHRGFETVTYMIDGTFQHQDSHGGGGLITDGATQWMTAGSGILHIETPPEQLVVSGGLFHGIQLWVNLPARDKFLPPAYQGLEADAVTLLASPDGGALVRVIAGELGGRKGPGSTHTPMALIHATLSPGAELRIPWDPTFNALAYVLAGSGFAGSEGHGLRVGQLAAFGAGDGLDPPGRRRRGVPDSRVRRASARWAAHRGAGRALRTVRDEYAGGNPDGLRGLRGRTARPGSGECADAPPVRPRSGQGRAHRHLIGRHDQE